jgi:hypothetical protein
MGLNDPLRISSLIRALPTDPDAPRTTAACVEPMATIMATIRIFAIERTSHATPWEKRVEL